MRNFRFLGRRNGVKRYVCVVALLVVLVFCGHSFYKRDEFHILPDDESNVNQGDTVVHFKRPKVEIPGEGGNDIEKDIGYDDTDIGKGSPQYNSNEEQYYLDKYDRKSIPGKEGYDKQRSQDSLHHGASQIGKTVIGNELQAQQQQQFKTHDSEVTSIQHDVNQLIHQQVNNYVAQVQKQYTDNQKQLQQPAADVATQLHLQPRKEVSHETNQESPPPDANGDLPALNQSRHQATNQVPKNEKKPRPDSYYDSEEDAEVDENNGNVKNQKEIPTKTEIITFSQYDIEEDVRDPQGHDSDNLKNEAKLRPGGEISVNAETMVANVNAIVPNIVHFIWFGDNLMTFHQMLSILSVYHFIKPDFIYYHCNSHPTGEWWERVVSVVSNLKVDIRSPPNDIFGFNINTAKQQADIAKLQMLMAHGGIYIDTDVIVTKSFEPLLHYEFSIGSSLPGRFDSDIVISTRSAKLLQKWLASYTKYSTIDDVSDDYFSCVIPYELFKQNPAQAHVVDKMSTPTAQNINYLYKGGLVWTEYFAVHLWSRLYGRQDNLETIRELDTPYGKLARDVYNKV